MKKYNAMYLKKILQIGLGISLPFTALFLFFAVRSSKNLAFSEMIAIAAFMAVGSMAVISLYMAWNFLKVSWMVETQQNEFGLQFQMEDAECLSQNAMPPVYATKDVLMIPAKLALHRDFIKSWKSTGARQNNGPATAFHFRCANGETYQAALSDKESVLAIRQWVATVPQTTNEEQQEND